MWSALWTSVGRTAVMAELDAPDVIDLNGLPVGVTKRTDEVPRSIERIHSPVRSVVADQNRVTHGTEIRRGFSDAPWRVQRAVDREVLGQRSISIEDVYKAALSFVEGREGHPNLWA